MIFEGEMVEYLTNGNSYTISTIPPIGSIIPLQRMYINKVVLVVTAVGFLGLVILFLFDPTHNYPTMSVEVELLPGEENTIRVPTTTSGFLQWSGTLLRNPYLWVETNVDGLHLVDYIRDVIPGAQIGFPARRNVTDKGEMKIRNDNNETVIAIVDCILAPRPGDLGSSKTWWYMVYGFIEVAIGGVIAIIKPSANVVIRAPAEAKGAVANSAGTAKRRSRWNTFRNLLASAMTACCLRKTGTGGTGINIV